MGCTMNIKEIRRYFDNDVPKLSFPLVAATNISVNVATISNAIRLAPSFVDFAHPDVLKFLNLIAANSPSDLDDETKSIMASNGFIRFTFYLTVYCSRLQQMLESHAINYLPMIGIPIESISAIEYYPCMFDPTSAVNVYAPLFAGDIEKLLLFCSLMKDNFVRVVLDDDFIDISATDILGYVEHIA